MRWLAACLAFSLSACTTFEGQDESAIGRHLELQVDCDQGAQVYFNANRADTSKTHDTGQEVDPTKLKGVMK